MHGRTKILELLLNPWRKPQRERRSWPHDETSSNEMASAILRAHGGHLYASPLRNSGRAILSDRGPHVLGVLKEPSLFGAGLGVLSEESASYPLRNFNAKLLLHTTNFT